MFVHAKWFSSRETQAEVENIYGIENIKLTLKRLKSFFFFGISVEQPMDCVIDVGESTSKETKQNECYFIINTFKWREKTFRLSHARSQLATCHGIAHIMISIFFLYFAIQIQLLCRHFNNFFFLFSFRKNI